MRKSKIPNKLIEEIAEHFYDELDTYSPRMVETIKEGCRIHAEEIIASILCAFHRGDLDEALEVVGRAEFEIKGLKPHFKKWVPHVPEDVWHKDNLLFIAFRLNEQLLEILERGGEMADTYDLKLDCQNCGKQFTAQVPFGCDAPERESMGVGQREIWEVSYFHPVHDTVHVICPNCGSDNVKKDRTDWPIS